MKVSALALTPLCAFSVALGCITLVAAVALLLIAWRTKPATRDIDVSCDPLAPDPFSDVAILAERRGLIHCPRCRRVSSADATRCYGCGALIEPTLPTGDEPPGAA